MASPSEISRQAERLARELMLFSQMLAGESQEEQAGEVEPVPQEKPMGEKPVKVSKKFYDNDPRSPNYNPEPPMQPAPPPPPREPKFKGDLLIKKGSIKVCRKCDTPIVIANDDIYGAIDLKKFDILDTSKAWPDNLQVDKKNGVCVTCPMCGELGLWLLGGPEKKRKPDLGEGVISL